MNCNGGKTICKGEDEEKVSYHPAGGDAGSNGRRADGGFLIKLFSGDEVDGQRDLDAVLLRFGHQVLDDAGALLVEQGGTDLRRENITSYLVQ